jgi:DMSO/TMAO reductase YedYZ molybdopterin-dependent catalytic subunit
MKKAFLTVTAIITVVLVVAFSGSGLKPTAQANSNSADWQLNVTGLVDYQLNLTLSEIADMPQTTVNAALICVDYPGNVILDGNWTGVRLWFLLETAGVSPDAVKVAFYASDGFSTDLTVETAKREDIILAYERNGEPLSEALRLVVPGKWGYKWISQVTGIELVNYDFKGYWESRGYSDTATVSEVYPNQPNFNYPNPNGVAPEFPSVLALLIPLILITLFAVILKKRTKKPQTRQALSKFL